VDEHSIAFFVVLPAVPATKWLPTGRVLPSPIPLLYAQVYGDATAFTIVPLTFKLPDELDKWAGGWVGAPPACQGVRLPPVACHLVRCS
jgi:hypothetical protein